MSKHEFLENTNLKTRTIFGISWNITSQIITSGLSVIINLILTRLLLPQDFGLLAMAQVFSGFITVLSKLGIEQSFIQMKEVDNIHHSAVFSFSLLYGTITSAVLVIGSPMVARYYNEPRLSPILFLIAFSLFINSLERLPRAVLNRKLQFQKIASGTIIGTLAGGITAVFLAVRGFGVWSLIADLVVYSSLECIIYWFLAGWRPRLDFGLKGYKDLYKYSLNLSGALIIIYWTRNADNLLIGKYFGSNALGFYSRAYLFMLLPVQQITDVIGKVVWASLARIQDDKKRVSDIVIRTVGIITLITAPLMFGAFIMADKIPLVFGNQWIPVISPFRYLCFVGLLQSVTNSGFWIYQSLARTDIMLRWSVIKGVLAVIGFIIGIKVGSIEAVAASYLIVNAVLFYFEITVPGRLVGLSCKKVIIYILPILLSSIFMSIIVSLSGWLLAFYGWTGFLLFVAQMIIGIISYFWIINFIHVDSYAELVNLIKFAWKQRKQST
jgi:O-antigen/teichoic acid export membrane protein